MTTAHLLSVALATLALGIPARAERQQAPALSPLAIYPGFEHDHRADEALFRRQEIAREQAIAHCMRRSGFEYTPMPAVVNPTIPGVRGARTTRQHPSARHESSRRPAS